MSWISIDIVSSTNLIQYHRECCPTTALTLKIDPFHTAHQSCPPPPYLPPHLHWPPPLSPVISPTYPSSLALSSRHVLGAGMGQI